MLDHEPNGSGSGLEPGHESATDSPASTTRRRRAASRPAGAPKAEAAQSAPPPGGQDATGAQAPAARSAPAAKRTRSGKKAAAADDAPAAGPAQKRTRKTATKKATAAAADADLTGEPAGTETDAATPPAAVDSAQTDSAPTNTAPAKKSARKTTARRRSRAAESESEAAAADTDPRSGGAPADAVAAAAPQAEASAEAAPEQDAQPGQGAQSSARSRRTRKRATAATQPVGSLAADAPQPADQAADHAHAHAGQGTDQAEADDAEVAAAEAEQAQAPAPPAPQRPGMLIFQAPVVAEPIKRERAAAAAASAAGKSAAAEAEAEPERAAPAVAAEPEPNAERDSRRRRRRGRNAGGQPGDDAAARTETPAEGPGEPDESEAAGDAPGGTTPASESEGSSRRRRRRRRRQTAEDLAAGVDEEVPPNTVVKIREPRERRSSRLTEPDSVRTGDDVLGVRGSVRLAAKQQRRRDGRSTRSRRAPIVSEAEFLARRESVERVMVVRQAANRMQIGVLEDGVLVEHYVNRESSVSYVGNVYLGKVQNVLPSMEAAFVDINKGRNAVLYAGEVNFAAAGLEGQPKRIESALKSGQPVLVQVTKDPIGHKGARLTSQISLPGRFLVYIPGGSMMGISRKLPDNERTRLKQILKKVVPEDGGVIVRTAAEGASEEELARDVERLVAQWEEIERRSRTANAPALLYGEPDLTVRVIRDIFNEDFNKLIVSGDEAYKTIHDYLSGVAPELAERLEHWTSDTDVFGVYRVDEQLAKGLDRKVWLPSGGSLVIDRTEAMVVIDVNTGKFTGQGSNSLEETVTRNNLEAAEEIVRQLRLRDLGGIIVIDFIDMVLESNRDLVLRRLLECLGRDRTKHQVAEVTSLGLVQMTRKRVGQGLLEAFSETCDHCNGRGIIVHMDPVEPHGRKVAERSSSVLERIDRVTGEHANGSDEHGAGGSRAEESGPHSGAAESRANRRRRRKGKHHEDEEAAGATGDSGDSGESAWSADSADTEAAQRLTDAAAALDLKAHAEDPDALSDELGEALVDTGRPRKRRRAASRPAGSPHSSAEAS